MKRFSSLLVSFALFATTAAAQDSQWIAFESLDPNTRIVVEQNSTGPILGAFERATADTLFVRVDGNTMSVPRPDIQLVRMQARTGTHARSGAFFGGVSGLLVGLIGDALFNDRPGEDDWHHGERSANQERWLTGAGMAGMGTGIGALIGLPFKWERGGRTIYDGAGPVGLHISPIVTGQERGVRVGFSFD